MSNPYLYILVRNDLASLNPGKAIAQACHAANQMMHTFPGFLDDLTDRGNIADHRRWAELYNEWILSAKGFGTTISLSVNEKEMRQSVKVAQGFGLHAGITHDPSYPLMDGQTLHLIPLDTCAFIFADKDDCWFLNRFSLVP